MHMPMAVQPRRKVHQITRSKTYGLTAFGHHGDIALEQQAGFPLAIAPRKTARLAALDRPSLHDQAIQLRRVRSLILNGPVVQAIDQLINFGVVFRRWADALEAAHLIRQALRVTAQKL